MDTEKIDEIRKQLSSFLKSDKKKFVFDVDCKIENRIKFIYNAIFIEGRFRFYFRFLVSRIAYYVDYSPAKVLLYRLAGFKIGKGCFISPHVLLDPHFPSLLTIGDNVILGWGAKLFCHDFSNNKYTIGKIEIKNGANIGAYSTIKSGVAIGENVEIPYACIVIKDIPDNTNASLLLINQTIGFF